MSLTRHSLKLRKGDMLTLRQFCMLNGFTASALIRRYVSQIVDRINSTNALAITEGQDIDFDAIFSPEVDQLEAPEEDDEK